ncbi:MAG: TetR/AcrR family transcriptional regulator [Xanthomonadales bacterium]|nr:TetR/AcrR family transcriptional regulator [Xanthomonadales bacterium]
MDYRQQILDSAEYSFAQSSFDSVSLKDIARPVGITPAMIHYYFGSKKDLLAGVLEQALEPMAVAVGALGQKQDADIEEFVQQLFSTMQLHPNLPLLFFRQVLLPGSPMQEHFLQKLAPRLGGALPELIRKGQKSGCISRSLDPSIAALMVMSLCVFPLLSKPLAQPALGISFAQNGQKKLQQHIMRFIQGGLQSP